MSNVSAVFPGHANPMSQPALRQIDRPRQWEVIMTRTGIGRWILAALAAGAGTAAAQPAKSKGVPEGVTVHKDLDYVASGHARQKLDLYVPRAAAGPMPVILWVHGGAWLGGSKDNPPLLHLIAKGYAVASTNYRLSQHALFPAQIADCKAAVRWLRANAKAYHLAPDRIGAAGASAGGHLVALLGTAGGVKELEGNLGNPEQSSRVQCVVDLFGPTDFTKMGSPHAGPMAPEAKLLGGAVPDNEEKAARANPIAYVTKECPPFLIIHGDKDPTVPFDQSELLLDALTKAGVDATLIPVKGGGHGGPAFLTGENGRRVEAFLEKHLKDGKK
jgi:acetyl esterase/lipase